MHYCGCKGTARLCRLACPRTKLQLLQRVFLRMLTVYFYECLQKRHRMVIKPNGAFIWIGMRYIVIDSNGVASTSSALISISTSKEYTATKSIYLPVQFPYGTITFSAYPRSRQNICYDKAKIFRRILDQ